MSLAPIRLLSRGLTVILIGVALLLLSGVADNPALRLARVTTNDPLLGQQWNLGSVYPSAIRATDAWDDEWHFVANDGEHGYVYPYDAKTGAEIGPLLVRYGQYGSGWTYDVQSGDFACSPAGFDGVDPARMVVKRCEVAPYWVNAVNEGGIVPVTPGVPTWVRYGIDTKWAYAKIDGPTKCGMNLLGQRPDPAYMLHKICQVQSRPWGGVIATADQPFTIPGGSPGAPKPTDNGAVVAYGVNGMWEYKVVAAGRSGVCSPAFFDGIDPVLALEKHCEIVTTMGGGVTIATIDVGSTDHPDLDGKLVGGINVVDGSTNTQDFCSPGGYNWGHGLGVAGIAAAMTNNRFGIAGVAPMAKIAQVKDSIYCDIDANDPAFGTAIRWAAGLPISLDDRINPNPAKVIMITTTNPGKACSTFVRDALTSARAAGVYVIAGVGMNGHDIGTPASRDFPLNCPNIASIVPIDRSGDKILTADFGDSVTLAAPGKDIMSLSPTAVNSRDFMTADGSSRAVPQVAGVASMMFGKNPELTVDNVNNRLQLSSSVFPNGCSGCGMGMLQADRAMRSAEAITEESEEAEARGLPNYVSAPADIKGSLIPKRNAGQLCSVASPCCTNTTGPWCGGVAGADIPDQDWFKLHLPPNQTLDAWIQQPSECPSLCYFDIRPDGKPVQEYKFGQLGLYKNTATTHQTVWVRIHSKITPVNAKYQLNLMWRPPRRGPVPVPGPTERFELR